MRTWALGAVCLCCQLTMAAQQSDVIPVGIAKLDVTPRGPVQIINVKHPTEATEVHQRLFARALAIGADGQAVVLVSFDGIGVTESITRRVALGLQRRMEIPRERMAICATHTHWAPHLKGLLPNIYGGPLPEDHQRRVDAYTETLTRRLEEVAIQALDRRKPARLSWTTGRATFAVNRRLEEGGQLLRDEAKRLMITWNPHGPVDHTLPVMIVRDAVDDSLLGVHFSYACHNVAVTASRISGFPNAIHGDWVGMAQEVIEGRHPGCVAICTIGCGGDQRPDFCGGTEVAAAHAREIGDEVDRLLAGGRWRPMAGPVFAQIARVELPLAPLPTVAELERIVGSQNDSPATVARAAVARHRLRQLEQNGRAPSGVPFAAQAWKFGEGPRLVFLTGEVCIDYQNQLKRQFGTDLWPIAYANATPCYIVSRRMLRKGGYEAGNSMFYYGWLRPLLPSAEDSVLSVVGKVLQR